MSDIIRVLVECNPLQGRVMVRKASTERFGNAEPIDLGNIQNYVDVFNGKDMGKHVGFSLPDLSALEQENVKLAARVKVLEKVRLEAMRVSTLILLDNMADTKDLDRAIKDSEEPG